MSNHSDDAGLSFFIVGAGAVEHAWAPVFRALEHYYDFPLTPDGATSFLARIVYLSRWHATLPDPSERDRLADFPKFYREICERIRVEVQASQRSGELRVRQEFDAIIEQFLAKRRGRFAVINTNWDTVVDEALTTRFQTRHGSVIQASHLHGSVWNGDPLYLPSELAREPYRSDDHKNLIGGVHVGAIEAMDRARHVVLYGLSLSPLDAELCQTLESGWSNSNLESIDIIDPAHAVVAHRVNLIVEPTRAVSVRGYHPGALDTHVDYTVPRGFTLRVGTPDA